MFLNSRCTQLFPQQPSFDFSDWNPEAPAGLQFLCLIPQLSGYEAKYEQGDLTGKVKISLRHRQQRLRHFKQGKTVGRDITGDVIGSYGCSRLLQENIGQHE